MGSEACLAAHMSMGDDARKIRARRGAAEANEQALTASGLQGEQRWVDCVTQLAREFVIEAKTAKLRRTAFSGRFWDVRVASGPAHDEGVATVRIFVSRRGSVFESNSSPRSSKQLERLQVPEKLTRPPRVASRDDIRRSFVDALAAGPFKQ